jgi:nicotinamide phosphoribosyltransferase
MKTIKNLHNILIDIDAYKTGHFLMHPKDATKTRAYLAPRKKLNNKSEFVMYGLGYFIHHYLLKKITFENIEEVKKIFDTFNVAGTSSVFPYEAFKKVVIKYNGYLPIKIQAIPEGKVFSKFNVPIVMVETIEDSEMVFLANWIETALQRYIWAGSTVATYSRQVRQFIKSLYEKAVDESNYWTLDWRLHDFGSRGTTSSEQSRFLGLAHLLSFNGTDTIGAVDLGMQFYGLTPIDFAGSVVAAEHSTVTSWGYDLEAEKKSFLNVVETFKNTIVFSFVSDSYDYKRFVDQVWCAPEIVAKLKSYNLTGVIRPDSGDPIEMVLYALDKASIAYGYEVNSKGYKVLKNVAVIQGDGMRYKSLVELYEAVIEVGYSPENVVVGMGGGLLQSHQRDDMSWSYKLCQIKRDGIWHNVQKNPSTSLSKKGWNPQDGIDMSQYITYYDHTYGEDYPLVSEYQSFNGIRNRVRA